MKETVNINTSLSALSNVMHALARKAPHIPYRNSKLTMLLEDSLGGAAKVAMLVHVAPEANSRDESLSTLNFADRVASVTLGQVRGAQGEGLAPAASRGARGLGEHGRRATTARGAQRPATAQPARPAPAPALLLPLQAKSNVESGKVFEAHEALSKKDKEIKDMANQVRRGGGRPARSVSQPVRRRPPGAAVMGGGAWRLRVRPPIPAAPHKRAADDAVEPRIPPPPAPPCSWRS
jgi:hypothetical protein